MRIPRIAIALGLVAFCLGTGVALAGHHITGTYTGTLGEAELTGTVSGNEVELSFDSQAGQVTYAGATP